MPFYIPNHLKPLLRRPVAILGGGVSGQALAELLTRLGVEWSLYDERTGTGELRNFSEKAAVGHDLAVFSPGFRVEHPWLLNAAAGGCRCMGELDFASLFWRGSVIAITGTNGKTTLTEFATHALTGRGKIAFACGNIGYSFSRLVNEREGGAAEEIAVCEVSSFQAEVLWHFKADALIWSNIAEDHLERHPGMKAYFSAKYGALVRCAPGMSVVGSSVVREAARLGFTLPLGCEVESEGRPAIAGLENTVFGSYPQRENFLLLRNLWLRLGFDEAQLIEAASTFRLGRHRLAETASVGGVSYWNDSKATNFHAVEAALTRFEQPVFLIAGGKAKGGDIPGFVKRIAPKVKHMYLIGDTKATLAEACFTSDIPHTLCVTLDEAVEKASREAKTGDHVLLSPGFASFDMFRGYDHRGDLFEQLVKNLSPTVAVPRTDL